MLLLLLSLVTIQLEQGRFEPLSAEQFEIARQAAAAANDQEPSASFDETFLRSALERRGHSGDRTFLQGCDLIDASAEAADLNADLVKASDDWRAYQTAVEAGRVGVIDVVLPTSVVRASDVGAALRADQAARAALSAPHPDGEVGDAVLRLRLFSMCEVDLQTGIWMQTEAVRTLFSSSTEPSVINGLMTLALHMDHLPRLQAEYAEAYLSRHAALGAPSELGLKLTDRSLINRGLPQRYATLILCEEGRPVFAGRVDLVEANRLRATLGLAPEDLEMRTANSYCA